MRRKPALREYFESFILSLVVVLFVRSFLAEAVQIPTGSMEDTLLPGDHLFINKFTYRLCRGEESSRMLPHADPRRRDIVVFRFFDEPGVSRYYVKRVVGLPGETVEIRAKQVFIDGRLLDEPYAVFKDPSRKDRHPRDVMDPVEIPVNHFFVMGDNRDRSSDSRFWGPLPRERIIGKPLLIWWSFDGEGTLPPPDGWIDRTRVFFTQFLSQTRWGRTGKRVD